jgi:dihydroxyacetone kinase
MVVDLLDRGMGHSLTPAGVWSEGEMRVLLLCASCSGKMDNTSHANPALALISEVTINKTCTCIIQTYAKNVMTIKQATPRCR